MMSKFKEWAVALQHCTWPEPLEEDRKIAGDVADFLDSLATLADGAPNGDPLQGYQNSISFVTKAYADYYQAKCAVLTGELAAAQQKIADLSDQVYVSNNDPGYKEQPRPVMTRDQFEALIGLIQSLSYEQTLPSPLMPDSHEEYYIARKALCGE